MPSESCQDTLTGTNDEPANALIGRIEEAAMTTEKVLSAIFAIAVLSACGGMPAPTPQDGASAGIGVLVERRARNMLFSVRQTRVWFVRLEGNDRLQYISTHPIYSNYSKDDYFYLLNAPPGRYAAVVTSRVDNTQDIKRKYTTYFPRDLVEATEVIVEPGRIVFMGELIFDTSTSFKDADDIQLHYLRFICPRCEDRSKLRGWMSPDQHYTATLHEVNQDEEARERFLATISENLGEVGWLAVE